MKNASDGRAVRSRHKILDAAAALMVERGVDALNVKAIAERAGVQRSTIYNHWPDQTDLVLAAIEHCARHTMTDVPPGDDGDTGEGLGDVKALARTLGTSLASAWGGIAASLAAAAEHDEALAGAHRAFVQNRRDELATLISRHCATGRLRRDLDANWAVSLLVGPMYYERLVMHRAMTPEEIDAHLDATLAALTSR